MSDFNYVTTNLTSVNLDISNNLTTERLKSNYLLPRTEGGTLNISTTGTNQTVTIGNASSTVQLNGDIRLDRNIGSINMKGFLNQLQ